MEDCLNPTDVLRPERTKLFGGRSHREEAYSYRNGSSLFSSPSKDMATRAREHEMARLKSELSDARKLAEALASRVGESEAKERAREQELEEVLRMQKSSKERIELVNGDVGRDHRMEFARELENKKRELSNLRLEMASVVADKARAEEATKAAHSRRRDSSRTIERLGKEIHEADEEHVLIELARIEAIKEAKEIEAQREVDAARYSRRLKESKARIEKMKKELAHATKLEKKLAATKADTDVLQTEMTFLRAMQKKNTCKSSSSERDAKKDLRSSRAELEAAKEELDSIKEVGFKYTASMDSIRENMSRISTVSSRLRKLHEEADAKVCELNAELLLANGALEAASGAEKRRQEIVTSLSISLSNLKGDKEKAIRERERADEEARYHPRAEIRRCYRNIDDMEGSLVAAMHELESIKLSEAAALDELRGLCERASKAREVPSRGRRSSTITVARFEYEYLRKGAEWAREVAARKVEAARAWVEAFGASEKEVAVETARVWRELEGLGGVECGEPKSQGLTLEERYQEEEKALQLQPVKRVTGRLPAVSQAEEAKMDPQKKYQEEEEALQLQSVKRIAGKFPVVSQEEEAKVVPPKGSVKDQSGSRRSSLRRRSISGQAPARPPSITLRRRRKVMRNLASFLGRRKVGVQEDSGA